MFRLLLCLALLALAVPARAATEFVQGAVTINPLDVAIVTTGGVPVIALGAGERTAGGWLQNPSTATNPLCISETSLTPGATSAGSTTCITPGQSYVLAPSINPVSVVSADSAHPFSGQGFRL
jgi:hypothetical protein